MYPGIEGKRVFITAAANGIGKVMAEQFLTLGALVHICDRDQDALEAMSTQWPQLSYTCVDMANEGDVARYFAEGIARLSGIDNLINNAGIAGPAGVLESLDSDAWLQTFDVNLHSTFYCCKQALPHMKAAKSGSIINFASTAGTYGYPYRTPYASAKWAIVGLTKSLSIEVGGDGIRVNAICPGAVNGDRMDRVIANESAARCVTEAEVRADYVRQTSLKTFVDPEDIAAMVLFLCSDAGAKVSGQALQVDGDTHTLAS